MTRLLKYPIAFAVLYGALGGEGCHAERISGHVFYKDGTPVKGAEVSMRFFAGFSGISPNLTLTDKDGAFDMNWPPRGDGWVTASKESEGFPNAAQYFYEQKNCRSLYRVNLKPGADIDGVVLYLDDPYSTVEYLIRAADTRAVIGTAGIEIQVVGKPGARGNSTVPPNGAYFFVLPRRSVEVKVTAPGFKDWIYIENQGKAAMAAHIQKLVSLSRAP